MQPRINLSSTFTPQRNSHDVRLVISVRGDTPVNRPPINVALVLDRSGSMAGRALAAAKEAAKHFASFLGSNDRVSVVAFDSRVETIVAPARGGDPEIDRKIDELTADNNTNLSAGWLQGVNHVKSGLVTGTNRVVLFTDGQANEGITDVAQLVQMASASADEGVSTTCIGFGAQFNEDLLERMARAGRGNYWYIEETAQMLDIFSSEIENLVAYAAQNLEFEITLSHPRASTLEVLNNYPVTRTQSGAWRIRVGDLYATSPRELALRFRVNGNDAAGLLEIASVRVEADVVSNGATEHRSILLPVKVNLDGADHIDAAVELTFLHFELAKAREDAVHRADRGDLPGAESLLRNAVSACESFASRPEIAEEIRDLQSQAERMAAHLYTSADRKYQTAYAMGVLESKAEYVDKLRRK